MKYFHNQINIQNNLLKTYHLKKNPISTNKKHNNFKNQKNFNINNNNKTYFSYKYIQIINN